MHTYITYIYFIFILINRKVIKREELSYKDVSASKTFTILGAHGKPVMFLHPKDCNGVLVELEQQ